MHARPSVRRLRLAAILFAGVAAAQVAGASEIPAHPGQIRYTSGTAPARADRGQKMPAGAPSIAQGIEVFDVDGKPYTGRWQVASVDASLVGSSPMITFRPATSELPASDQLKSSLLPSERAASENVAEGSKTREPGFWAAALSTLALAVFFFLRRLS